MRIIAASQNKHKISEIQVITKQFDMEPVPMKEAGLGDLDIVEDGATFEENSFIKANTVCKLTGEVSIADDTGLMVDALNGEPGVFSARYSGEHGDDAANVALVLEKLKDVPEDKRGAKFVCAITMCYPDGRVIAVTGECHGKITHEVRGTNGFGYDGIFMPDGYDQTFGELASEIKNSIGHRARALQNLNAELSKL